MYGITQRMFQILSVMYCVNHWDFKFQPFKQQATLIKNCGKDGVLKLK